MSAPLDAFPLCRFGRRAPAVLALGALLIAPLHAAERFAGYEGTAFELANGKMIYVESHYLHFVGDALADRVVLYRCPNGKPFGRKVMAVKGKTQMPEFQLEDARLGYREGLETRAKGLTVFYKLSAKKAEKSDTLDAKRTLVADAGFDEFVRANWTSLVAGTAAPLDFVVPSQLDYLGFKVKWVKKSVIDGEAVQVFKLAPSGILGWVTSGLDVTYADSDRSLRQFAGLSNIRDLSGENYEVKIDFPKTKRVDYPDAVALNAARTVALVTSCQ
jgi:hypothetical protein